MAVAVLSPQDCLPRHHHHHPHLNFPANKPSRTPNANPNTSPTRSARRSRNSPTRPKSTPVVAQIRILKRGDDLSPPRRGSEPVPIPIPNGFYAGSAFYSSPPPSDLPVPAFFSKKSCGFQNQEIASELRRVLKLI